MNPFEWQLKKYRKILCEYYSCSTSFTHTSILNMLNHIAQDCEKSKHNWKVDGRDRNHVMGNIYKCTKCGEKSLKYLDIYGTIDQREIGPCGGDI